MTTTNQRDGSITGAIGALARVRRRYVMRLATVRALWLGLGLLLLAFYLDAALQLTGPQRAGALALDFGAVLGTWGLTLWFLTRSRSRDRMLARLVEGAHPELNNELINAVDFEARLAEGKSGTASVPLMQAGIGQARAAFDRLEGERDCLKPAGLRRESRLLYAVLAVWLGAGIFLGAWLGCVGPRFLWPWGDHPPYNATTLWVEPGEAVVDYGKDLEVRVTAEGRVPEEVWLMVGEPDSDEIRRVGMFSNEPGVYFQTFENIRTDLTYYAAVTRGRSHFHRILLSKIPRIESVDLLYRYPAYTRLPDQRRVLNPEKGVVKGYQGTAVTMTVRSNRPLQGGWIEAAGQRYPCLPDSEYSVQAVVPLVASGPFSLNVTDVEGRGSQAPVEGQIEVVPDGQPMVSIVSPGMQSLALPDAEVPLVIEAQDDLGIRGIRLYCSHNESDDSGRVLWESDEVEPLRQVTETLDLADLGVRPGDVIDYYATATDSLPSAPQTVASEAFQIQIISKEEYARMLQREMTATDLREKYERIIGQLEELIEAQRELQHQTETAHAAPDDPSSAALRALASAQAALGDRTGLAARQMAEEANAPPVFDIEADYKKGLAQFAEHLTRASGHMGEGAGQVASGAGSRGGARAACLQLALEEQAKALAELGDQTEAMRAAIEQASREMERMMALITDVETFKRLYLAQKHLTRQTKTLRESQGDTFETRIRFAELSEQETAIREDLLRLQKDLFEHAGPIEADYPRVFGDACKIVAEISQRKIPTLMEEGTGYLNQGDGPPAYDRVLAALEQMEAMIAFCESTGGMGCKSCEFRLRIKFSLDAGNTFAQLSQGLGMGMGMGSSGAMGRGVAGFGGGQTNMAIFGGETFGKSPMKNSLAGGGKHKGAGGTLPGGRDALSGNIESLSPQEKKEIEIEVRGQDRIMAEYSGLIEAYFRRMAEDE